jgi:ubiquitin-protein ligase E3 A
VIVCGQTDLDFHDLQAGCTYQDGYDADSPAVAMFWQVLYEFDNAEKKAFLRFLTGSDRCPVGGLRAVELVVSRNTDEEARLPSAHTCFNHLLLPEYKSLEVMRERVRFAMGETEGFGLR